jgi:hypothetical protein
MAHASGTLRNRKGLTMNIHEMSDKYGITVGKLRKLHAGGHLLLDDTDEPLMTEIRYYLRRGAPLAVKHLMTLLDDPARLDAIGKGRDKAQEQLDALGKPITPAPLNIALELSGAAMNEPASVETVMRWAMDAIPPYREVSHPFLAVRLLLGLPENQRKYELPRIHRTMLNVRKRAEFRGWWRIEKTASRNVTIYSRPAKSLDL